MSSSAKAWFGDSLPFEVWYVPQYPISAIDHTKHDARHHAELRARLADNIRQNGLVNPLIVLNHPREKCPPNWLMVGTNRLAALKMLGWRYAPCIVTGPKPVYESVPVASKDVPSYFRDGEPYVSAYGIALRNTTKPETFRYPNPCESFASDGERSTGRSTSNA